MTTRIRTRRVAWACSVLAFVAAALSRDRAAAVAPAEPRPAGSEPAESRPAESPPAGAPEAGRWPGGVWPRADRVVVISVDGLRPDLLLRCDTPHLHALVAAGSYTFWAKTVAQAITLPSHASMLTGVNPRKHGIEWNKDLPLSRPVYPAAPTLFEAAKAAGYSTGMASGKSKFDALAVPGSIDHLYLPPTTQTTDADVADHAARIIRDHRPQVMFVHLPGVDNVGHAKGWGTPAQVAAVGKADAAVGIVLRAVADAAGADAAAQDAAGGGTAIILTADHGGAGRNHGPDDARARHIPWVVVGPGVRADCDLTQFDTLEVHTEDTFATACAFLGIPLSRKLDGRPVAEILADPGELLHPDPGSADEPNPPLRVGPPATTAPVAGRKAPKSHTGGAARGESN